MLFKLTTYMLSGAIGFGIGAVGFGAIRIQGWSLTMFSGNSLPSLLGYPVTGALGGAALGFVLRDMRRVAILAIAGAIAYSFGLISGIISGYILHSEIVAYGVIPGFLGGGVLGTVLLDIRKMISLALAGGFGFGIAMLIVNSSSLDPFIGWATPMPIKPWLGWVIWGTIGGASLGLALGYIEIRWPYKRDVEN